MKVLVYFSDFFAVDPREIEKHGAFNISLINDLPLFVDPFLLFNSRKPKYKELHKEILRYVAFLRDTSKTGEVQKGLLSSWYRFPEIKQNWLGYSRSGNSGRGPGIEFAKALDNNLRTIFSNFDAQKISHSAHLEKLCLIRENIGRDNISDFATNLVKGFLLEYTQEFCLKHVAEKNRGTFSVPHVEFNYETCTWETRSFVLPAFGSDYVLLTPKDILTKDETWINKRDIIKDFHEIVASVPNPELRGQLNHYFLRNLPKQEVKKDGTFVEHSPKDISTAIWSVARECPDLLDYYIKYKEEGGEGATSLSKERVKEVQDFFVENASALIHTLTSKSLFYKNSGNSLAESFQKVLFLKDVIENKDGYRLFYIKGKPVKRELDLQIMFRLTWHATRYDVSPETNAGRGPVDYKVSMGASDKTLVEFKLASNSKLEQNLENQVEVYKKAHDTEKAIKVILFFSEEERVRVMEILRNLKLENEKYVVLIDARNDNKPSASNVK